MLMGNSDSKITIATDKLSVGVDVLDFQTVIVLDPKDLDDLWQKGGHVGHDCTMVCNPQVIIYIPSQVMKAAQAFQDLKVAANRGLYTAPRVLLDSAGFHRIPVDLSPGLSWCDKGQIGIFCLAESGGIWYIRAESTEFRHIFPLDKSGRVQQNLHWT